HVAVSEFARHVLGLDGANSTEMDPETPYPVIDLLPEQKEVEDLGGTMRLGAQAVELRDGVRARTAYTEPVVHERHRHRYEVNNHYRPQLVEAGLVVAGTVYEGRLVEIVELPDHPWVVASQFHPEFKSRPTRPAPPFREFVGAALARAGRRAAEAAGCSVRTAAKWVRRFRAGDRELLDRSSRPHRSPARLPSQQVEAIEALRRLWMTAAEIAEVLALPLSTVSLWLRRLGLGRRSRLKPLEPPNRYERRHPG